MLQEIKNRGITAVIRDITEDNAIDLAEALRKGKVTILEITMENPHAVKAIKKLVDFYKKGEVIIGAGTVLNAETAKRAIEAGAEFIFTPTVQEDVIKVAKNNGKTCILGAMTPTEINQAYNLGADAVKVFPANVVGIDFIKGIKGPLPHIPLLPTGGINVDNIRDYLDAGAIAVGIGSNLTKLPSLFTSEDLERITNTAKQFVYAMGKQELTRG
ncbi:MAG: bifunctional 4-hydroxy-2-oxoglutarate aldolase/2-dehydro-3-deoxy-phosphogluconate aldolase [Bacillus sp. (in: firmicutes)]